jgi:hypothetical protein
MPEKNDRQFNGDINISDLYPDLTPDEQREAEYRLLRYLEVVKEVFDEICASKPEILTELEQRAMLRKRKGRPHS